MLKSMSIKQGLKFDSPESAREIPAFIEFHKLNIAEIRDPLTSFSTSLFVFLALPDTYKYDMQRPLISSSIVSSKRMLGH